MSGTATGLRAPVNIAGNGPLGVIATGLRTRLELLFPPDQAFTHRWMPARLTTAAWRSLTERTPLIGLGFNMFHRSATTRGLTGQSLWSVFLATRNERSDEARLFGDTLAPGILALAQVAAAGLHGMTIQGGGTLQMTQTNIAVAEEFDDAHLALATLELTVEHSIELREVISGTATDANTILREGVTWVFDGHTARAATLQPTGTP